MAENFSKAEEPTILRVFFSRTSEGFCPDNIENHSCNPDLIIFGEDKVASQTVKLGPDGIKSALFYDEEYQAILVSEDVKGDAFGIGIVTLLYAVGWIELLPIDWGGPLNRAYWESYGID